MIGMTQAALAEAAGISTTALNNIERGAADPKASTLTAIQKALEAAGVIFVPENGEGPGVRLRKGATAAPAAPASEERRQAGADHARLKADKAADRVLIGVDASEDEKATRRDALTEEPAMIKNARRKARRD